MSVKILRGDVREQLATLPDQSVHCVVTSPPYWGLRDYGCAGQFGLESTVEQWLESMLEVFRSIERVLRLDGTCWVQMGDCWRDKQLVPQSWMLAMALQRAGWYLRQCIVWEKPAPMPETLNDRCTNAHEYLFLLTRSARYFWDKSAMQEPTTGKAHNRGNGIGPKAMPPVSGHAHGATKHSPIEHSKKNSERRERGLKDATKFGHEAGWRNKQNTSMQGAIRDIVATRNKRSVWRVAAEPYPGAHFATFPSALIEPCILAGCPIGGVVLDPFGGAGTTGLVADRHGRNAILIELNPEYADMAERRITGDSPLFAEVT